MDTPKGKSWRETLVFAEDKEFWKSRVRSMRQQPVFHVELDKHVVEGSWSSFTVSSCLKRGRVHDMLCCKGVEDAVIVTSSGAAHTHHTTTPKVQ